MHKAGSVLRCASFAWLLAVVFGLLAVSCGPHRQSDVLVQADSALVRGDYTVADSLLRRYAAAAGQRPLADEMYYRLLQIGLRDRQDQPLTDLLQADSLLVYYRQHGPRRQLARALFFMGSTYRDNGDVPTALDYYMQAINEAAAQGDLRLMSWIYRQEGEMYESQEMYEECAQSYLNYYQSAVASGDKRQTAFASYSMGEVYVIMNKADSAIYYYKQAIKLGSQLKDNEIQFVKYPRRSLSDLYIQLEEYDEALRWMDADSIYDYNRAFLYQAQNRIDSAIFILNV